MTAADHSLERHYRIHLKQMAFGLAFSLTMGTGMILALIRPGLQPGLVIVPTLVFVAASVAFNVAVRGRQWHGTDPGDRAIHRDEWVQANLNRARRTALWAVFFSQVPLMFFAAYVPAEPSVESSVIGMAILTMATAQATFFGSYLLYSRPPADG